MQDTKAVMARVTAKLQEGIAKAEAKYGQKFPMPIVSYELRGTVAGYANYRRWSIRLNFELMMQNVDEFIERTVPHELAHLITDRVYPEAHQRGWSGKREVHGPKWQSVCAVLGMTDITRCHSYDTTATKVVRSNSRQIPFHCAKCKFVLQLTPRMAEQMRRDPLSRWHKGCRGWALIEGEAPTGAVAQLYVPPAPVYRPAETFIPRPPVVQAAFAQQAAVPTFSGSKIDKCKALYVKHKQLSRKDIINKFVAEAGCTPAGAATYYATCTKVYG